ncbi:hypothetical protein BDV96DRAFT_375446 [Lophiotrema nucula]|uniref:Azaphilone pigments biosynthesis cluster protein L N-terminal domain-containing protein n=1 Tax=Lophiotrema nucula TaxID=690887 RepID=A0A6A5YE55_9PLEO|nr:hypothetical protein BDV96DRAFT_375446 [Lophiotrema nucula]
MDPLSITASIVGILAAAGKLSELLSSIISTTKDAPQVVSALVHEVKDIQAALSSLQVLLDDLSSSPKRRTALIQIDSLIVTFTESVVTFSELERIISPFAASTSGKLPLRTRLKWARAEGTCLKVAERLQRHKSSITLMLNILQCTTDAEADCSQASLQLLVEQLLDTNKELCKRMKNLEDTFDAQSSITRKFDNFSLVSRDDETITTSRTLKSKGNFILETIAFLLGRKKASLSCRLPTILEQLNNVRAV